jgi:hypothetical protein
MAKRRHRRWDDSRATARRLACNVSLMRQRQAPPLRTHRSAGDRTPASSGFRRNEKAAEPEGSSAAKFGTRGTKHSGERWPHRLAEDSSIGLQRLAHPHRSVSLRVRKP